MSIDPRSLLFLLLLAPLASCEDEGEDDDTGPEAQAEDQLACPEPDADAVTVPETLLYFERNDTDGDTGLHGLFDQSGWKHLCVYDPTGAQMLSVQPMGGFGGLGMASLFFESREPPHSEVSVEEHLATYPEGTYEVRGLTWDGITMTGEAWLTHTIPAGPVITAPENESVVPLDGLVVEWEPVTETWDGSSDLTISGYQVIVTNEEASDDHGWSVPIYDVHVRPEVNALEVPATFLEAGTLYEIEVLALEESGNQTITAIFFETE